LITQTISCVQYGSWRSLLMLSYSHNKSKRTWVMRL
jgi:hypothetical protein